MITLSLDTRPLFPWGVFLVATLFLSLQVAAQCPPAGITPSPAGIVYVNKQVAVSGNGSSWATAVKELADALPAAKTNAAIQQIWVAQGTYNPLYDATTGCAGADPRDNTFLLENSVQLFGGFTGTETDPSQRILNATPSILSGDIGVAGNTTDNCYHVVISAGPVGNTILDGFHITGGNAGRTLTIFINGEIIFGTYAGGLMIKGSSPAIRNCYIARNTAQAYAGGVYIQDGSPSFSATNIEINNAVNGGGGVYVSRNTNVTMNSVTIQSNETSGSAGGLANSGGTITIENSAIRSNKATESGGGFYQYSGTTTLNNTVISLNNAGKNGGGFSKFVGNAALYNCVVSGNTALLSGGGCDNGNDKLVLNSTTIELNSAANGGGIQNSFGQMELTNVTIKGNTASTNGAAAKNGGDVTFTNGLISGNRANGDGGGWLNSNGITLFSHVTIASNSAGGINAGFYGDGQSYTFNNCIVWGNAAGTDPNLHLSNLFNATFTNSIFQGMIVLPGAGNNNADPLFVAPQPASAAPNNGGDYHLQPCGSPAIDAGSNALIPAGITTDLGGQPRIYNAIVDMGCFEAQTSGGTIRATDNVRICQTQLPYTWNAQTITAGGNGVATFTTTSSKGCDSTVTLNLEVIAAKNVTADISICQNQLPYVWNGKTITAGGNAVATYKTTSSEGCDSTVTLNLTVNPIVTATDNVTICQSQLPYTWNGQTVNSGGNGVATYTTTSAKGCDSTVTLNLTVNPVRTTTENINICSGELPYTWHGQTLNSGGNGIATFTTVSSNGCDSIVTLNLIVNTTITASAHITICRNQLPYSWNGQTITAGGNAVATYSTTLPTGCDSITTLDLTVKPVPVLSVSQSVAAGCRTGVNLLATGAATYSWSPATWLSDPRIANPVASPPQTTSYTVTGTQNGCSSVYTLQVVPPVANEIPNAFTPNGDGRNDCFGIRFWGNVINLDISVFNRWGQQVFRSTDPNACWDGKFKGADQPAGTYIYFIKVTAGCGTASHQGSVTLIR